MYPPTYKRVYTCIHTLQTGKGVTEQKIISSPVCPLSLCLLKLRTSPDLQDKAAPLTHYSFVPWKADSPAVRAEVFRKPQAP